MLAILQSQDQSLGTEEHYWEHPPSMPDRPSVENAKLSNVFPQNLQLI